jgi:hypothetical protein
LIDRATARSRDERVDLTSRVLLSALRLHLRYTYTRVGSRPARLSSHPAQHESSCFAFAGAVMEFVEHTDDRPEPISIARCRELLGEKRSR